MTSTKKKIEAYENWLENQEDEVDVKCSETKNDDENQYLLGMSAAFYMARKQLQYQFEI